MKDADWTMSFVRPKPRGSRPRQRVIYPTGSNSRTTEICTAGTVKHIVNSPGGEAREQVEHGKPDIQRIVTELRIRLREIDRSRDQG